MLKGNVATVQSAAFSPDGKRIVTASVDNTARVWDAARGKVLATLEGHSSYVYSAAYSPDGKRIVTASRDETARVWDAASGKVLAVLEGHSHFVYSAAYSPDGKRIVTASADKTARVWEHRRPEQWWGVAWMPEFWLTLVLGVALVWSLIRDRRTFKVPGSKFNVQS